MSRAKKLLAVANASPPDSDMVGIGRSSDRILDPYREPSPLLPGGHWGGTFWDQYFSLQELAMQVEHLDGRLSLTVTNQTTGEQYHFADLRLQIDDGSQRN